MPSDLYQLKIFDKANNLIDVPADAIDIDLETTINGGSGSGYISFPRQFFQIGAIGDGYRVQLYLPSQVNSQTMALWYDGRITKIDRYMAYATRADVKAYVEGWMTACDFSIVSEIITPGVQSNGINNGQLDAGDYLVHLAQTYLPAPPQQVPVAFGYSGPDPIGLNLDAMQFDGAPLGAVFDDVIKSLLDNQNNVYEWLVVGSPTGAINLIWRPEQNPNTISSAAFLVLDYTKFDQYQIVDDFTRVINQVVAYGGKDPTTGMTVWGAYSNSTSIALYGLRQGKISKPTAISQTQINYFATAYLNEYAFPQQSGGFRLLAPDARATAGQWVQIQETPAFRRQMKLLRVNVKIKGQRVEQFCYVGLPLPSAEHLAQGPDPTGSYNSARLGATDTARRTDTDSVLSGMVPTWVGGSNVVTYSAGVVQLGGQTYFWSVGNIALNNGSWSIVLTTAATGLVITAMPASVAQRYGHLVLDDFNVVGGSIIGWRARAPRGSNSDTSTGQIYQASIPPLAVGVTVTSSASTTAGVSTITVSWTAGTIFWPNGTTTALAAGSSTFTGLAPSTTYYIYGLWWSSHLSTPLAVPTLTGVSTFPGGGVFRANSVHSWIVTAINNAGETSASNEITATASSSGVGSFVLAWNTVPGATAYNVYRSDSGPGNEGFIATQPDITYGDNGTIAPGQAPPASNTALAYSSGVTVPTPQTSTPTIQQKNTPNMDGNVAISANFSVTTPASGSSGGGGGHGNTCPLVYQTLETSERGPVAAADVEIGEHLPGSQIGEWKRVLAKKIAPCQGCAVTVEGVRLFVDTAHLWMTTRGWVRMELLTLDDTLVRNDGTFAAVEKIEHIGPSHMAMLTVEDHVYSFGGLIGHNFPIVTL